MIDLSKWRAKWVCLSAALAVIAPFAATAAEATLFSWDFRNGEAAAPDWQAGWVAETEAARADGALRVVGASGQPTGREQALVLMDVFDSSHLGGNDRDGTPVVSYRFSPIERGLLGLRAGTTGSQDQQAVIALMAKGRELLLLKIRNNTTGSVVSGSGENAFSDSGWFNRARDFEVSWSVQPDGSYAATVTFRPQGADPVVFGPLRFLAPGAPDQLRLQVGYGTAVGKGLRLEKFFLSSRNN